MKVLEIKEFSPAPGNEWAANAYPGDGVYLVPSRALHVVGNGIVTMIQAAHLIKELPSDPSGQPSGGGISEGFVLKALAIAQHPQLAVELTR